MKITKRLTSLRNTILIFAARGNDLCNLRVKKKACLLKQLQKNWTWYLTRMSYLVLILINFHWRRWQIILSLRIMIIQDRSWRKFFITCKRFPPNMETGTVNYIES